MKSKCVSWILLVLLFLPELSSAEEKKYRFGDIKEENGFLVFNFQVRDLLDKGVLKGLQKGMTAAIEYQV